MHHDATWSAGRPQSRGLCVRWEPSPLPKRGRIPPQFSAHVYCGQTARCIKMPLGMEVGLSSGDFVLDGDSAPQKGAESTPQFSAHFYCGQTARCTKMPLGMDVGLSQGDSVLDADPVLLLQKGAAPKFSDHVYCGQTAGWIKMPLGTESPQPRRLCVR